MIILFDLIVAALHAAAAWTGLSIYTMYFQHLPVWEFRLYYSLLLVFFTTLVSLTYFKFFSRLSALVVMLVFLVTAIKIDYFFFYFFGKQISLPLTMWDFVVSLVLLVATIYVTKTFMKKK